MHARLYTIAGAHRTHHLKRQLGRFSRFCTADATFSHYGTLYTIPSSPPPKKKLSLPFASDTKRILATMMSNFDVSGRLYVTQVRLLNDTGRVVELRSHSTTPTSSPGIARVSVHVVECGL